MGLFLIVFIPESGFITIIIILNIHIFSWYDKDMVRNDCILIEDQVYYPEIALPLSHPFHNAMKIGELGSVECESNLCNEFYV